MDLQVQPEDFENGAMEQELTEDQLDRYSDKELLKMAVELEKKNEMIDVENELFDAHYARNLPKANDVEEKRDERPRKKRDKKEERLVLTPEQKVEIVTRELEELKDEMQKKKDEWGKQTDNYKAEIEEVEVRLAEGKKASYEFKRDIVQGAVSARTGKVIAEKLLRYYDEKIRAKDALIEKIRLKNATMRVQKNKLHLQLKQKEEMGEVLHAIDFDQLQIENKQYLARIEERNRELLKLKLTAAKAVQVLNSYKQKLHGISTETTKLKSDIHQRSELYKKLSSEETKVGQEKEKAKGGYDQLKLDVQEFRVPQVMDYVELKAKQNDLERKKQIWQRKVDIMSMQTQRLKRVLRKHQH